MEYQISDNILKIKIDESTYTEAVVYKCFYWYCREFNVEIDKKDGFYNILFSPRSGVKAFEVPELIERIKQDLIDFKLRDIVTSETRTIRELIIAKAFANFEIEEFPQTSVSDPVGFDPQNI